MKYIFEKRNVIFGSIFAILVAMIFTLALRGLPGNPKMEILNTDAWRNDGPFELSPQRGRFALLYSIMENKSLKFTLPVAEFSIPDLAISSSGEYVSLFAPGVSFMLIPGYALGKIFGISQVGTFALITIFAIINFILIFLIAIRLGAKKWGGLMAALTFSFATPAFAYGVDLYQHHISVFFLLLSLYVLLKYENFWMLTLVWFACVASVVVDNPNVVLMFPIGIFSLVRAKELLIKSYQNGNLKFSFFKIIISTMLISAPLIFLLWYNLSAYGSPWQLPGTLPSVPAIGEDGKPKENANLELRNNVNAEMDNGNNEKTAVGFFQTRNLYNGFYEHFVSADRGILFFTPVILLGFWGLSILYRRNSKIVSLILATIGANILLYSMWGDPYGGWAFGSRYLIPTYSLLALGIAMGFSKLKEGKIFLALFIPLFLFSAWVNSLGAITSSANPPRIQVLAIEAQTGHEQKYNFFRNWDFLHEKYSQIGAKAFIYQSFAKNHINAVQYFALVYGIIVFTAILCMSGYLLEKRFEQINANEKEYGEQ